MDNCKSIEKTILIRFVLMFVLIVSMGNSGIGQTNSVVAEVVDSAMAEAPVDTVTKAVDPGLNQTQKSIFKKMKEITKVDENTIFSVLGVIGVLSVVGIAMYMSFKDDDNKKA